MHTVILAITEYVTYEIDTITGIGIKPNGLQIEKIDNSGIIITAAESFVVSLRYNNKCIAAVHSTREGY